MYLEILGSRKPVIFLEGENSSIDYQIYSLVYGDYLIKPLGGCEQVIQSVKSFNNQIHFHHIQSFGIIDRDRRNDEAIAKLNSKNIWVLDVAEVENLLLLEDVIKEISRHMGKDPQEVFENVKSNLLSYFGSQLNSQILLFFKESYKRELLEKSEFTAKNIEEAIAELDAQFNSIDKNEIYESIEKLFKKIVEKSDYPAVLRYFNLKNALIPNSRVCELTGVKNKDEYYKLLITLMKRSNETSSVLINAIKSVVVNNHI